SAEAGGWSGGGGPSVGRERASASLQHRIISESSVSRQRTKVWRKITSRARGKATNWLSLRHITFSRTPQPLRLPLPGAIPSGKCQRKRMTKSNNARLDPAAAGVHRGKGKRAMGRSMARREPRQGELCISRRVDAYGDEGSPKSAAGVRTVPLSAQLVSALKAWKIKSKFSKPNDLIFANRRGGHTGNDNLFKRHFLPLFDTLPVKRFNWHGLRHFAISCWIEAGMTPKTVQTFAGHSSLQITMDRYGHLFPSEDHKKAMDQIARGLFK